MPVSDPKAIFSRRLKGYRQRAGLSMDGLIRQMDHPVSKNAISRYENGIMMPDSEVLISIARALGVSASDLLRPFRLTVEKTEFRKKSKLGVRALEAIRSRIMDRLERYVELEEILGIKSAFYNPLAKHIISEQADIEKAALELRKKWALGLSSVVAILEILEEKEIKIIEVEEDEQFDGLCGYANDRIPFIVINKNHDPFRRRMTALHELGHLLLIFNDSLSPREIEKLSSQFSGAFLLPEQKVVEHIGKNRTRISINELITLKEEYGISIAAIIYRLEFAGIISETSTKNFWIKRNSTPALRTEASLGKWNYSDTADRFQRLLHRAMAEELITISKASELSGIDQDILQENLLLV